MLLLAVGAALIVIAQRRNWRPSLAIALYTALVLRLVMLALAYRTQPYDLVNDFQTAGSIGTKVAVAEALLAVWWWRRAHPLDIATATTTALLAITPSFGTQYLLWQAPSATARPARLSVPLQIVLGAYAAIFYLPMQMLTHNNWVMANALMMLISLFVIAFMIAALPWQRRQWHPPQPQQHHEAAFASDAAAA